MHILITGASSGIGYELAKCFAKDSECTVYVTARSEDKLNELKENCRNFPGKIIVLRSNLENDKSIHKLCEELKGLTNRLDVLINNAGLLINKDFESLTSEDFHRSYSVNLVAPALLISGLMNLLKASVSAHVVNVSSMGGFQGSMKFSGLAAYSSSKAALVCLTELLAEELKHTSIKLNCLALGAVQTEMLSLAFPGYHAPVNAAQMAEFIEGFARNAHHVMNGRIIPVTLSTP